MKLVNPDFLGFTIDYKFIGIELQCKDFKDQYAGCVYIETGCYGCTYLEIGRYSALECGKNHSIRQLAVCKEDGLLVEGCATYMSRYDRYGRSGCVGCDSRYQGTNHTKCRLKKDVREEILRM